MFSFFTNYYEKIILASMLAVFIVLILLQVNVVQTIQNQKVDEIINRKEPATDQSLVDFTQPRFTEQAMFSANVTWKDIVKQTANETDLFAAYKMAVCPFCRNLVPSSLFPQLDSQETGECIISSCRHKLLPRQLKTVETQDNGILMAELEEDKDKNQNGVPDEWEKKYNVYSDMSDEIEKDHDDDGFTTKEEYELNLDPIDPLSHPKYITRLFCREVRKNLIRNLLLDRVSAQGDDKTKWDIQFRHFDRNKVKKDIFRLGEEFRNHGIKYKIADVISSSGDEKAPNYDTVLLIRTDRDEKVLCKVGEKVYEPKELIVLHFGPELSGSMKRGRIETSIGEKISLGNSRTGVENFQVEKILGPKMVTLVNIDTKESVTLKEYVKPEPKPEANEDLMKNETSNEFQMMPVTPPSSAPGKVSRKGKSK